MYKSFTAGHLGIKPGGFEQTAALAARHGFGAVGYSPAELEQEGLDVYETLDVMGRYGVIISDFGLPVQITGQEAFNETFPHLEKAARTAAKLGIHRCCTWVRSWSDEMPYAENFRFHTKMFRTIAEALREYGILFGLEFLGPVKLRGNGKYPFIGTIDEMLELCDAVGTGNMGLLLDAHHCYSSGLRGGAFAKHIRAERDIVLVHLNDTAPGTPLEDIDDSPRFYPGEPGSGGNDLPGFLGALLELKYTGPVAVEPFSRAIKLMTDPDAITRLVSDSIDSVWPSR